MMDEPENTRARLEALYQELSDQPDLDERGQQLLTQVRDDLARLETAAGPDEANLSLEERDEMQSRWKNAVVDFENSHPQLAQGLERMAVILSNFGL